MLISTDTIVQWIHVLADRLAKCEFLLSHPASVDDPIVHSLLEAMSWPPQHPAPCRPLYPAKRDVCKPEQLVSPPHH